MFLTKSIYIIVIKCFCIAHELQLIEIYLIY